MHYDLRSAVDHSIAEAVRVISPAFSSSHSSYPTFRCGTVKDRLCRSFQAPRINSVENIGSALFPFGFCITSFCTWIQVMHTFRSEFITLYAGNFRTRLFANRYPATLSANPYLVCSLGGAIPWKIYGFPILDIMVHACRLSTDYFLSLFG